MHLSVKNLIDYNNELGLLDWSR